MRKLFIAVGLLLAVSMFTACERVLPTGEVQEVSVFDKAMDIFSGRPVMTKRDEMQKIPTTGNAEMDKIITERNAKIEAENEKIREHNKAADKDQENPDTGILGLLALGLSATGYGWANQFLKKKNMEKLRNMANGRANAMSARYQAAKEVVRSDVHTLDKMKKVAQEAENLINESNDFIDHNSDTISKIKKTVKLVSSKVS